MINHLLDKHHMDIHADNEKLRDFFHASSDSGTPLHCAVYRQNLAAVQTLLKRGADPKARGGTSLIYLAIGSCLFIEGYLPALGPLIDAGANVDQALQYAVEHNSIEAAQIAIGRGATVTTFIQYEQDEIARAEAQEFSDDEDEPDEDEVRKREEMRKFIEDWKAGSKSTLGGK